MLRNALILCALFALATTALGFRAHETIAIDQDALTVRFAAVDIIVDLPDGTELGSYQVELAPLDNKVAQVRVVGIEGGEHAAFKTPPFYDPKAIGSERVILAAYSTAAELPTGRLRIARVHYEITGRGELPALEQLLTTRDSVTTDRDGDAIDAPPTLTPSQGSQP